MSLPVYRGYELKFKSDTRKNPGHIVFVHPSLMGGGPSAFRLRLLRIL